MARKNMNNLIGYRTVRISRNIKHKMGGRGAGPPITGIPFENLPNSLLPNQ